MNPAFRIRLHAAVLWALFPMSMAEAQPISSPPPTLTTEEVVQRFMERSSQLSARMSGVRYSFHRETVIEEFDSTGQPKTIRSKEHRVEVQGIDQTSLLCRLDGKPLADQERMREQQREEVNRQKFASRSNPGSRLGYHLDSGLLGRYRYRLQGSEEFQGRWTYLLRFEPNGELEGGKIADRVLARMGGSLWVDAAEFEPVRLEATLLQPVSIGVFLAVLDDFRALITRRRLPSGSWVDDEASFEVAGRKLIQRFHGRMKVRQDAFLEPASTNSTVAPPTPS